MVPLTGENKNKVIFSHPEFAAHLMVKMHGHGDPSNTHGKQYHGSVAIRCFNHIKSFYRNNDSGSAFRIQTARLERSATIKARIASDSNVLVVSNEEEVEDAEDPEMNDTTASTAWHDCLYPIKYIMHHLSQGFADVNDVLFNEDPDFWDGDVESHLRDAWLQDFQALTPELKGLNTSGMSPLHVAAAIEAPDLVSVLVSKCGKSALAWKSHDGLTAVCQSHTSGTPPTDVYGSFTSQL